MLGLTALCFLFLAACGGGQSSATSQDSTHEQAEIAVSADTIPYRVAERYFAASDTMPNAITTEEEAQKYLGMATTMSDGPTSIDWTKEFIIPVVLPETSVSTEIIPVSLERNADAGLTFTYRVVKGEDMKTSTMRPFAAVIVSREYLAPVTYVAQ